MSRAGPVVVDTSRLPPPATLMTPKAARALLEIIRRAPRQHHQETAA